MVCGDANYKGLYLTIQVFIVFLIMGYYTPGLIQSHIQQKYMLHREQEIKTERERTRERIGERAIELEKAREC